MSHHGTRKIQIITVDVVGYGQMMMNGIGTVSDALLLICSQFTVVPPAGWQVNGMVFPLTCEASIKSFCRFTNQLQVFPVSKIGLKLACSNADAHALRKRVFQQRR